VGFFFIRNKSDIPQQVLYTTTMISRKLLVTHHTPDLDAVGAVWLLKRFVSQEYATAKIAFVNPGDTISANEAHQLGVELHEVTHVDTGLGEFDHHQEDRGKEFLSATLLTHSYACKVHPELKNDAALEKLAQFITEIDHFQEVHWPESEDVRYCFMIHELIKGMEYLESHTDDTQLNFGMT
jgi:nanoRNase/pAp phosphatase (c-di-AMP/oligoRNAs hydrolase)